MLVVFAGLFFFDVCCREVGPVGRTRSHLPSLVVLESGGHVLRCSLPEILLSLRHLPCSLHFHRRSARAGWATLGRPHACTTNPRGRERSRRRLQNPQRPSARKQSLRRRHRPPARLSAARGVPTPALSMRAPAHPLPPRRRCPPSAGPAPGLRTSQRRLNHPLSRK